MAEIGIRLGADNSQFRSVAAETEAAGGKLFDSLSHKFTNFKALGHALATGLGLNIEKIAENVARFVTGVTKAEEEQLKSLSEASEKLADSVIKNIRARSTEEQKYTQALQKNAELQIKADDLAGKGQEKSQAFYEIRRAQEEYIATIQEHERKAKEEDAKKADAYLKKTIESAEAIHQKEIESLEVNKRVAILKLEIKDLQVALASGVLSEQNATALTVNLEARKKELAEAQIAIKKASTISEKETHEFLVLQSKLIAGLLTPADRARYDILVLQTKELKIQAEIDTLLAIPAKERTIEEQARLRTLYTQDEVIQKQIATKQALIATIKAQAEAEGKVTAEITKQVELTKIQISNKSDGRTDAQLTDAQIQEKISNLKKQVFDTQSSQGGNQWLQDILINTLQGQANAAQSELSERLRFRNVVNSVGEERALASVSAFDQDRYKGYISDPDSQTKLVNGIQDLNQRLENAGFRAATVTR